MPPPTAPGPAAVLSRIFGNAVTTTGSNASVSDPSALASKKMDDLVRLAVFGDEAEREISRWCIWEIGQTVGVRPASIHALYMARGRGDCHGFTAPAINVRGMSYHTARSIFRTAIKLKAGAFLLEIARSEQAVATTPATVAGHGGPLIELFQGSGRFNEGDLKRITLEFEKKFTKPLPVSAKGETAVHRTLGFDHRGRVDIGVAPDSPEGAWMRGFLAENRIPYIAFRRSISGQATAAHIHIGTPSPKLAPAD